MQNGTCAPASRLSRGWVASWLPPPFLPSECSETRKCLPHAHSGELDARPRPTLAPSPLQGLDTVALP